MNIHRKEKPGCEILVNHCKNVCENASFTIQNVQKLTANAHKNWSIDHKMLGYRL